MKKFLFLISFLSFNAFANNQFGFILGSPTGLSFKKDLGNSRSIDAALAYTFRNSESLVLHSTYLFENQNQINLGKIPAMNVFFGLGGRLAIIDEGKHKDDIAIGLRLPVGLTMDLNSPNIQLFTELSAVTNFMPDTDVDFDFGIGARIKF